MTPSIVSVVARVMGAAATCGFCMGILQAEVTLLSSGAKSSWKYRDDGSNQKTEWRKPDFDASAWKAGPAPLGYGEAGLGTTVGFGPDSGKKFIATYFRTSFAVKKDAAIERMLFTLRCDDGAVVFLNGDEILRSNMSTGIVTHETLAEFALSAGEEEINQRFIIPAEKLKHGENIVAVEVHQASERSSDLYLDLEITGYEKGETPGISFYDEGRRAAARGNVREALSLLSQVPEESKDYATAMVLVGYELFAQTLGEPEKGIPFVRKAYEKAPGDMMIVRAYIRTHVLAKQGLSIDPSKRTHAKTAAPQFAFLASKVDLGDGGPMTDGNRLLADLDYLELMMANCYSYLERTGVDWEAALDALRLTVKDGAAPREFAFRLDKFLSLFGDPHSRVQVSLSALLPAGQASFAGRAHQGRVFLFKPDRSGFLDKDHRYVRLIDGVPIARWLEVAGFMVSNGSPQYQRLRALELLPRVGYVRAELGLKQDRTIKILLESEDRKQTKELSMPVRYRGTTERVRPFPDRETGRIGDIGYLRIDRMDGGTRFLSRLVRTMNSFKDTKGLIIDVRDNGGGTQDTLRTLMPFFMKEGDPMKIVNIAAYRMPLKLPKPNPSGFLGLYGRGLHPAASSEWSPKERKQIIEFLKDFKPSWKLPEGKFSDWHVMAVKRTARRDVYHYDKPVVVLGDAGSFSATDNFLGAFKGHPNVTLMGEASGGGSGRRQSYELPRTKIPFTLCQMASYSSNGRLIEGNGVEPDVEVETLPENHVGDGDAVLEAALNRLRQ